MLFIGGVLHCRKSQREEYTMRKFENKSRGRTTGDNKWKLGKIT
jgi:hypothetical protein